MAGEPTGEPDSHEPWPVRVLDGDGRPAGSGFLFARGLVLTCAHVVTDALGVDRHSENGPRGPLRVVRRGTDEAVPAQVMPGGWVPLRDLSGDFAILSLDARFLSSATVDRARSGGRVRVITPDGDLPAVVQALPGSGEPDGWGLLAFEGTPPRPSGSGSPVVDDEGAVVGLLTALRATGRARHAGYFLPLAAVVERLVPSPPAPGTERRPDAAITLRELGELVEALLAVPVLRDLPAFDLLARELQHEVPGVALVSGATARLRALQLVRQFARRPEDLRLLVETLRVFDSGSSEVEAFETLVDKVAAPSLLLADERRTLQGLLARTDVPGGVGLLERARDLENRGAPPGRSPALLEFVSHLAASVAGETGAGLDTWRRSVATRLGMARPARPPTEQPVLAIRVDTLLWDADTYGVTATVRAAEGTTMLLADDRVPYQELMPAIAGALRTYETEGAAAGAGPAGQVEFVLPYRLLDLPVDELDTDVGDAAGPLGARRPVVVRAAELEDRADLHRSWHARWRRLKETLPEERAPRWVDGVDGRVLLLDSAGLTFRSAGDAVAACLLQGVPVLIRSRGTSPAAEEALAALAGEVALEEMPEAVRAWRLRHALTGDRVTLLYADPERPLSKDEPLVSPDSG
ncbi:MULTISPECIES: trypsin-like peptidase domain-containing protein [unclassified Streptomyces]|uniref:VMAP-C domain-containing protein n=1 Tax=unclassified Streptomyces TaxID=2593676 RepID=UPI00381E8973